MNLPEGFIESLSQGSGAPLFAGLPEALSLDPVVSVRIDPAKTPRGGWDDDARAVPWAETSGRYLQSRPAFIFDPLMHQGAYYVQDASSMFLGHAVRCITEGRSGPVAYLDACAAPGGKTGAAIDALPPGSVVWANEYVPQRAAVLRENLAKKGYPLTIVTTGDTARFAALPASFDIIAADVPCSGEGMMRKDAEAVAQWSPGLVAQCAELQRSILQNLWVALRPGGFLIYSTCTFNRRENEDNVRWLIETYGAETVELPADPAWGIAPALDSDMHACRFIPGRTEGEGLFLAVLRKPGDEAFTPQPSADKSSGKSARKDRRGSKPAPVPAEAQSWLTPGCGATLTLDGDRIMAVFPQSVAGTHPGLEVGTVKGRDAIPSQQLALSRVYRRGAFPEVDVDRSSALMYLRGEAPQLPSGTPRGHLLLTYRDLPLGFVKNIGNRCNNLYPRPWRILSALPSPLPPLPHI